MKGIHVLQAFVSFAGKGHESCLPIHLICAASEINGKQMTIDHFKELPIEDAMFLFEQANVQMTSFKNM